jgi:hypothetical protein
VASRMRARYWDWMMRPGLRDEVAYGAG